MKILYFGAGRPRPRKAIANTLVIALVGVAAYAGFWTEHSVSGAAASVSPPGDATLRVAIAAEPTRLDPHDASDGPSSMVNFHIYDRLVELDERMEPTPSLATSWSRNAEGDVWTLTLRSGVRFHDGSLLSAHVVKENFDRLLDPSLGLARRSLIAGFVREVVAIDDLTIEISLYEPVAPFLKILAHDSLGILAERALKPSTGAFVPIGTGPFKLGEWVPGTRLELKAFERHWRGAPQVDRIVFSTVPAGSSRAIMLETGEIDFAFPIEPAHLSKLSQNPGVIVEEVPTQRLVYLALNTTRPPFDDARVRRAASQAIDREEIAKYVLFGFASPSSLPIAEDTWGYAPVPAPPFDPGEAAEVVKTLLPADERRTVTLWAPAGRYPQDRAVAQAIGAFLGDVGFKVEIRIFEWGAYLSRLQQTNRWDAALLGWVPSTGDADMALRPLFSAGSRGNHSSYASDEVNRLIEAAARELDPGKRLGLYKTAIARIVSDMPIVPLYAPHLTYARRAWVHGVRSYSTETIDFRFVSMERISA